MAQRNAHLANVPDDLCQEIVAEPEAVRAALEHLPLSLAPCGLSADVVGTLELILAEVLNNIVKHAYRSGGGAITLRLGLGEAALWCEVCDTGAAMPGGHLPAGAPAAIDVAVDDLPEGGFGWFLIRTLAQDLSYHRDGGTNRLSFSLPLVTPGVDA